MKPYRVRYAVDVSAHSVRDAKDLADMIVGNMEGAGAARYAVEVVEVPARVELRVPVARMTKGAYRDARKKVGTQPEVAKLLGVASETISKRERGVNPVTREAQLAILRLHTGGGS